MDCSPWGRKESGTTEQLTHITHNIIIMATMHKGDSQVVLVVKNLPANARDARDVGSTSWVGKTPWRKWQPTPIFLLEKSHGQRSLVGYSPWGRKESDTTE